MAFRKERHPDMNLNEIDYSITYQICQNFDIDRSWEQLAGVIGYSTSHIQTFELETRRPDGSPTKKVLWDWGTRGATLRDLYNKLNLINKTQTMRLLEPIMKLDEKTDKSKHDDSQDSDNDRSSIMSKDDNLSLSSNPSIASSGAGMLPIPKKIKKVGETSYSNVDVNLNTSDCKPPKPSEKDKQKILGITGMGTSSVKIQECHADGPASGPGNLGAAASSVRSFERVKSVVEEYDSNSTLYMSQLSNSEKEIARALIAIPHYTYKELSQATEGFSMRYLIGEGKFGKVYKGRVKNTEYAIKKLFQRPNACVGNDTTGHLAGELKSLSRYRHESIVSLYAYALDGDEICLVYQYMHNGSLEDCLHKNNGKHVLTWEQRLVILRGAACGLQFLHSVDPKPVIHGDIKSSNILLDKHLEAKIGDLGIAQQATGGDVTGEYTHITKKNTGIQDYKNRAYLAPEISRGSGPSLKGDTFAFGVVMYECLTGQQAFDSRREGSADEKNLVVYIENHMADHPKCNKQKKFEDQRLDKGYPQTVFTSLFDIAERCTMAKKKDRPSMIEVYKILETAESSHTEADYCNITGSEMTAGTPKLQDLPLKKQTSSDENTTNGADLPPLKVNETLSPVDYLPPDQLPESVKLQMEVDKRKEIDKACDYVNVSKLGNVQQIFRSDPKKLAEIEKCDHNFKPGSMNKLEQAGIGKEQGKQMCEIDTNVNANKIKVLEVKQQKYEQSGRADEKIKIAESHDYVNVPVEIVDVDNQPKCLQANMDRQTCEPVLKDVKIPVEIDDQNHATDIQDKMIKQSTEPVHDFDAELELIKGKAAKPNSSMMDIFTKFDNAKGEKFDEAEFGKTEFDIPYDDYMDFQFDFEKEGSDCSTLKLSQSDSEKMDSFHMSDVRDEDLFGSDDKEAAEDSNEQMEHIENRTVQMKLGERDAGENEEASSLEIDNGPEQVHESIDTSLNRHRMKQAQYANIMGVVATKREGDMMVDDLIARKGKTMPEKDNANRHIDETMSEVKGPPSVYPGLKVSSADHVQGPRVPSESEYEYV